VKIYLLDTNIIIDILNNRHQRMAQVDELLSMDSSLACTSITITEVYMGMRSLEAVSTEGFLSSLDFFPVTPQIAQFAGHLFRQWRQKGQTLSFTDVSIAAVCIANGLTLVTNNEKHFPMLELERISLPNGG
jgi:predicted nucleic acid-binding protein